MQQDAWLLSRPTCAALNQVIQTLTEVVYKSCGQHKESCFSRMQGDSGDALIAINYLLQGNLFDQTQLIYIYTVDSSVKANVHSANEICRVILTKMRLTSNRMIF